MEYLATFHDMTADFDPNKKDGILNKNLEVCFQLLCDSLTLHSPCENLDDVVKKVSTPSPNLVHHIYLKEGKSSH